uniref:MFS domain-containing protein n=1 Tax=Bursaphelenchus xylophilus TaxID=6326 RepID=A0A1I7S0A7_BURXY
MDKIRIRGDERTLETVLICVHSVFGLVSMAVNALALYKSIFSAADILGAYKLILINQSVVNFLLAASVVFLQLRIFITPFGNVFAVLGLASFTNHFIAFLVYTLFSSLFLDYYFLLLIGMLYNCHWIHKSRYGPKMTSIFLLAAAVLSFADFVLSGVLFYEDEDQSRQFSRNKTHETVLNRHMVFAVRVHENVMDIVVNYIDAIFMVFCIAMLIFLRYRIRVYLKRHEQELTYIQSKLINGLIETFAGLGYTAGPVIGAVLYEYGGFQMPFLVLGFLLILATVVSIFLVEDIEDEEAEDTKGMLGMLKMPVIWLMVFAVVICAISLSFFDPTLAAHLESLIIIQASIMVVLVAIPSGFYFLLYEYLREAGCDCIMFIMIALALFLLPIFVLRMLRTVRHSHRLHNDDNLSVSVATSHLEREGPSTSTIHRDLS